jgi:outer membrane receptor protein involved in Fe transport/tetratricopeptide (TPR) repeat protein
MGQIDPNTQRWGTGDGRNAADVSQREGDGVLVEAQLKRRLRRDARSVDALCGLAGIYMRRGWLDEALRLVRAALEHTQDSAHVWGLLTQVLLACGRLREAEESIRKSLRIDPDNAQCWIGLASVNNRLLRPHAALEAYQQAGRLDPAIPLLHLSIGHVLKTLGRRADCERVYHECIARESASGEAYWSLADLKNYVFSATEVKAMTALVAAGTGGDANLARLHFALGRAYEQRGDSARAFAHYDRGNRLRRVGAPFDYGAFEAKCRRIATSFDRSFFEVTRGAGHRDGAPIFIVGMPRSGSTLVEQILASHSCVEGTMELPNVLNYVREFEHLGVCRDAYPESARSAPRAVFETLGRRYIEETRPLRSGRARFIDKMPNNFAHIGLIHAALPQATIIDVRRHPMDACFSCFKQHFAAGQAFSYDLEGLGHYYRQYLGLMDHWDAVLPGKVLHLTYEDLVRAPEEAIRLLLAHCGLPFERGCLDFHLTQRPIRTASSEQVRQPLYAAGIGYWRRFEQHLEPLRRSLGDCLDRFPEEATQTRWCGRATRPSRQSSRRKSAVGLAVAAITYAGCTSRVAVATGPADVLPEVVVTARKRSENLEDVPQNIDVLSSQDLENEDVVKIEDFATLAPSISLISTGPGGQRLFIRGASDGSDANFGHSNLSTTGFMVDDLSFSYYGHVPDLHLFDIERIEILNGPQGTLFGPGALSGAVRIITKKPDPRALEAAVEVEGAQITAGGNNSSYEGYLNIPLIEGTTALRVSAYEVRDGGYIDNVLATRQWINGVTSSNANWAGRKQNTRDVLGGRISLQHALSEAWLLRITAYYQRQRYRGSWDEDPTNVGARALRRFSPQGGYNYGRFLELHAEGDVGIGDLIYAGGYSSQVSSRLYDFSDYAQYSAYASFIQPNTCVTDPSSGPGDHGCKVPYMYGEVGAGIERWSNELRLQSKPRGRAHWTIGAYWEKTRDPYHGFEHLPNINFNGEPAQSLLADSGATPLAEEFYSTFATSRYLQTSEFADLTVDLSKRWSIEAGIEHFHSTSSDSTHWAAYFFQPKTPAYYSASSDSTNFKAGVSYRPGDRALVYFAFAQGFRDGGFNYIAADFPDPTIPRYFRPDTLNNFELGWKSQYFQGRLRWDGALYYMPWKDYQVGVSVPGPPFNFDANVGDARIYGIESTLEWRPLAGLRLAVTADYNNATLRSDSFQNPSFSAVPGERLPEAPALNFNAIGRYEWNLRAAVRLFAQLDVAYKGSMWNDLRIDVRSLQPAYSIGNLRLGASRPDGTWQAEAFISNLGNSNAVLFVNATGYDTYPGVSNPVVAVPPRTFGLRLRYRWGGTY